MFLFHSSTKKKPVLLLSLCQTLYVTVIIGAKMKVATKFYRKVKQKSFLPNMLLKGFLVKLKYSFQGPIQTDENYMPLLTLLFVRHLRQDIFQNFHYKFQRDVLNMLLKGCLVKSIFVFQGPMKTDENYISLLTPCLTPQVGQQEDFPLQILITKKAF